MREKQRDSIYFVLVYTRNAIYAQNARAHSARKLRLLTGIRVGIFCCCTRARESKQTGQNRDEKRTLSAQRAGRRQAVKRATSGSKRASIIDARARSKGRIAVLVVFFFFLSFSFFVVSAPLPPLVARVVDHAAAAAVAHRRVALASGRAAGQSPPSLLLLLLLRASFALARVASAFLMAL